MRKTKNGVFRRFFLAHFNLYIFLIGLFLIGFITGIIHATILGDDAKTETYAYITTFISALKTKQLNIKILCNEFLISNLKPAILLWLFGLWIIGIPLVCTYIAFEGYALGFVVSVIINSLGGGQGSLFIGVALLPQEIVIVPILLTLGTNSILFANSIWKAKSRTTNIKFDIYRYVFLFVLCVLILLVVSVFQTYVEVPIIKGIFG